MNIVRKDGKGAMQSPATRRWKKVLLSFEIDGLTFFARSLFFLLPSAQRCMAMITCFQAVAASEWQLQSDIKINDHDDQWSETSFGLLRYSSGQTVATQRPPLQSNIMECILTETVNKQ